MQKLIRSGPELSLSILRSLALRGPSEVGVCFSHSEVGNADAELRQNMSIRRNLHSEMFTLLFRILNILIGCCLHNMSTCCRANILEIVVVTRVNPSAQNEGECLPFRRGGAP